MEMEHVVMVKSSGKNILCNVEKVHQNGNMKVWYKGFKSTIHMAKSGFDKLVRNSWINGRFESINVQVI